MCRVDGNRLLETFAPGKLVKFEFPKTALNSHVLTTPCYAQHSIERKIERKVPDELDCKCYQQHKSIFTGQLNQFCLLFSARYCIASDAKEFGQL